MNYKLFLSLIIIFGLLALAGCTSQEDTQPAEKQDDVADTIPEEPEISPSNMSVSKPTGTTDTTPSEPTQVEEPSDPCSQSPPYERISCYVDLAIQTNDDAQCELGGTAKNACYQLLAIEKEELDICENIDEQRIKDGCYNHILNMKKRNGETFSSEYCEKMENQRFKNSCYHITGTAELDLSLCNKIIDQEQKDLCYAYIGQKKEDVSICEQIVTVSERDNCYLLTAASSNNCLLCDKVVDSNNKEQCLYFCKS